ncbi:MmcQ/YjbR family DNA-binding protein [candidate division KSB1 bacterium]|nr:MmcQ/YjbR family DNA-binding protein [candidate division KSB1 bacterium]
MKPPTKKLHSATSQTHLQRVRRICASLPGSTEKLSHGEPTFFVAKKVFCMFADDHHHDGHLAVWLPAPIGIQEMVIAASPEKKDRELDFLIRQAWRMIAPKKLQAALRSPGSGLDQKKTAKAQSAPRRRKN